MSAPLTAILTGPNQSAVVIPTIVGVEKVVNVKDPPYNAKGDGVTDDAAALRSAMAAAVAGAGKLFFPPGTYLINTSLGTLSTPILTSGSGYDVTTGTVIKAGAAMTDMLVVTTTLDPAGSFEYIQFNGNGLANNCITLSGASTTKISFHDVKLTGAVHIGLNILCNHTIIFYHLVSVANGSGVATDCGVFIGGPVPPNVVQSFGSNIEGNNGSGVIIQGGDTALFDGGVIEGNAFHGVWGRTGGAFSSTHVTLDHVWLEGNNSSNTPNTYDIYLQDHSCVSWVIKEPNLYFTNETFGIWNGGVNTLIELPDMSYVAQAAKGVHWDSTATGGTYTGTATALDPAGATPPNILTSTVSGAVPALWLDMETLTADSRMQDLSQSARDGAITGTTDNASGKFGHARTFATTDFIASPKVPSSMNMTIAGWAQWTVSPTPTYTHIVCGPSFSYELRIEINNVVHAIFYQQTGPDIAASIATTLAYNDGTWHHFCGVLNNGFAYIYVDGNLIAGPSSTQITSILNPGGNVRFGLGNASGFAGSLDEVYVFPVALNAAQVSALYNNNLASRTIQFPERARMAQGSSGNRGVIELYDATAAAIKYVYIDNGAWVISSSRPT